MKLQTQKSVAIRSAPKVKLESVDNSTAVAICGNYQTVTSVTVMALEDNTRSHPKNHLNCGWFGNPEALIYMIIFNYFT